MEEERDTMNFKNFFMGLVRNIYIYIFAASASAN